MNSEKVILRVGGKKSEINMQFIGACVCLVLSLIFFFSIQGFTYPFLRVKS